MTRPPVLTIHHRDQLRELLARTMHDANTGRICPDPDDPTRYGAMADAVMTELKPLLDEYRDAIRRLAAFPHPDAIPDSLRPWNGRVDPTTLTELVDILWRHVGPNSVGAPPRPSDEETR